ncbi:hypothetical protein OXX59_004973, partial [Metschnikowia pulcherrima]
MTCDSKS